MSQAERLLRMLGEDVKISFLSSVYGGGSGMANEDVIAFANGQTLPEKREMRILLFME